jgi:hypothetical protein
MKFHDDGSGGGPRLVPLGGNKILKSKGAVLEDFHSS